jgi:hypothetical protein
MTKDDFDRPDILNVANPHPESGYAHGMHVPKAKKNKILFHSVLTMLLSGPIPNNN